MFIVGHLRGEPRPKVFPIGEASQGIFEQNQYIRQEVQHLEKTGNITYSDSTLLEAIKHRPISGGKTMIRRLTPLECLRLQGFPDDWFDGTGVSDTQKYKMLGNAVTVNVVHEVARRLT